MSNTVKFTSEVLSAIFEELALGRSIKAVLKDKGLSWEGFRKTLHKKAKIRQEYETAKQDGVQYLLDCGVETIQKAIEDLKDNPNQKNSMAISHLQKEIIGLLRFKATHLLPKYSNKQQVKHSFNAETPLVVKWSKD